MRRCAAEVFHIGPIEAGIVVKSTLQVYMGCLLTAVNQLLGADQSFDGQVTLYRNAGGVAEDAAKLGTADEELFTNVQKRDVLLKVFCEIPHDLVGERIYRDICFLGL